MDWQPHHPTERELNDSIPNNIPCMLHERARQTPDRDAFVFFDDAVTLTYAQLDEQVRRVAQGLLQMGVRKGTHVAMMLPNVVEFPVTWFSLAWIGAVCVQLNPKFTGRELDYALNDADVDFLIIDETCVPALDAMQQRTERLPDDNIIVRTKQAAAPDYVAWHQLTEYGPLDAQPRVEIMRHDVMSILYTSGTTGFPKGCMLDHYYWLQLGTTARYCQGGHIPRNVLIYEPMFYMQGNAVFVAALLCNATVFCSQRPSISKFLGWVAKYSIDYCAFPVPAVHVMEDYPAELGKTLKWVHGWYFHGDARERIEQRFGVVVRDSYGMTENGLCLFVPVDRPDLSAAGSVGIPAPWRDVRIVDSEGNDVADGEVGELWTAGIGQQHGYYRKTQANRDSFEGRWFKTGDLMRREASGAYFLVGRMKDMIKRSGENVSAAEVEACLSTIPGVVMAAVVGVPDAARDEEIKAYVQLEAQLTPDDVSLSQIFAHCEAHLAAFKIPRYLAYVSSFPMTAGNDKISKPKLISGIDDLARDAYDRVDERWR